MRGKGKIKRGCTEPNCDRVHYGKGYCHKHWQSRVRAPLLSQEQRRANNQKSLKYYKDNQKRIVARNRLKSTGVTQEQFEAALVDQEGKCALCLVALGACRAMKPVADHCHVTNRFRGVLHSKCNIMLGGYEAVARMPGFAGYLEVANG